MLFLCPFRVSNFNLIRVPTRFKFDIISRPRFNWPTRLSFQISVVNSGRESWSIIVIQDANRLVNWKLRHEIWDTNLNWSIETSDAKRSSEIWGREKIVNWNLRHDRVNWNLGREYDQSKLDARWAGQLKLGTRCDPVNWNLGREIIRSIETSDAKYSGQLKLGTRKLISDQLKFGTRKLIISGQLKFGTRNIWVNWNLWREKNRSIKTKKSVYWNLGSEIWVNSKTIVTCDARWVDQLKLGMWSSGQLKFGTREEPVNWNLGREIFRFILGTRDEPVNWNLGRKYLDRRNIWVN